MAGRPPSMSARLDRLPVRGRGKLGPAPVRHAGREIDPDANNAGGGHVYVPIQIFLIGAVIPDMPSDQHLYTDMDTLASM